MRLRPRTAFEYEVWASECPEGIDSCRMVKVATYKDLDTAQAYAEQQFHKSQSGDTERFRVAVTEIGREKGKVVSQRQVYERSADFNVKWSEGKTEEHCTSLVDAVDRIYSSNMSDAHDAEIHGTVTECNRKILDDELVATYDFRSFMVSFTPKGLELFRNRRYWNGIQ